MAGGNEHRIPAVGVCRAPPRVIPRMGRPYRCFGKVGMADPVGEIQRWVRSWVRGVAVGISRGAVSGVRGCLRRVAGRDVVGGIADWRWYRFAGPLVLGFPPAWE